MKNQHDQCIEGNTCQRVFPVFTNYRDELLTYASRRIGDPVDSEAVVSDVLMKVYRNCEQLESITNIRAWLYQITRRAIYDYHREQSKSNTLQSDDSLTENEVVSEPILKLASVLPQLIACLPPKYAVPLRLSELEAVPQKQIAQQLGLSVSGAKSRIQRGRRMLREMFQECLHLELDRRGVPIDFRVKSNCITLMEASKQNDYPQVVAPKDCDC